MIISTRKSFVFIHIPRTGGTAISNAFRHYGTMPDRFYYYTFLRLLFGSSYSPKSIYAIGSHASVRDLIKSLSYSNYKSLFSFSFCRNPFTRIASHYLFYCKHHPGYLGTRVPSSFPSFIRHSYNNICTPQCSYLMDEAGILAIDYLGRFETLRSDFSYLCNHLGLVARLPNHKPSDLPIGLYDSESIKLVQQLYEQDFKQFSYSFDFFSAK